MSGRVAVVTGSNKGIGLAMVEALCRRLQGDVYLTSRDEARGRAAVLMLQQRGLRPLYHQLDVADPASVAAFRDHLQRAHGGIDILINNAGVVAFANTYEESKRVVDINYRSLLTIQEFLFPLLRDDARVLNISSDCGHLSNIRNKHWVERLSRRDITVNDINQFVDWYLEGIRDGTFNYEDIADGGTVAAYRVAKVAMCALTVLQQRTVAARGVSVNALHPGLVRTDMTADVGFYSSAQAADNAVRVVLDRPDLRGQYVWYDGRVLDWYDATADYYFKSCTLPHLKEGT